MSKAESAMSARYFAIACAYPALLLLVEAMPYGVWRSLYVLVWALGIVAIACVEVLYLEKRDRRS